MSSPLIPCQRFGTIDSPFWQYGPGAFCWRQDVAGSRTMLLLVPSERERGYEPLYLYMRHAANNWAEAGEEHGWDGDEDRPTLSPSVSVPGGWHGFMENGQLRTV